MIKTNYGLAQYLKTFTENDLKSQRRFDLASQPKPSGTVSQEPGSVHVRPADGDEGKRSSVQQRTVPKTDGINKDPAKSHGSKTEQKGENKTNQNLITYLPPSESESVH